ncbi:hypothetical protein Tco_1006553 [Tanacetum coccineum]|uniref:Uncharacterized protein n=1 Tax=Tanacetum coccineum TaxID=301880 RepID=A0ABQ5FI25_9ASTR
MIGNRLFQPMFDEYFTPPSIAVSPVQEAAAPRVVVLADSPVQSRPKKNIMAVKRIFRYLKGTINMGLWYSKDTGMSMTAYADADHAGCQDTRRNTSGSAYLVENILLVSKNININTTQAQLKALDDALVASVDRLEFRKCNMRLKTDIKPKEATFQVVLDALALTTFYCEFLITADFCPKTTRQKFEDLPLEHDILSFIRDLGHTGDVTYLTNVNVDYLHQPWRAFSTVINKCLSGKETGMDKISCPSAYRSSGYDIYMKELPLCDPIDELQSKDQSISRRNKMFWHTDRDDIMFTSMRCISRHEDTQVYGTILPKELINQAMLESNAYKTYYAFAFGEKTPKPKYVRKKADSNTSPKQKPVQATKGTRIKSKAKVSKSDKKKLPAKKPKAKGLAVLFEVALTKAEQLKLATKRSKTQFFITFPHARYSGEWSSHQSKVPDKQQQKTSVTDEGTNIDEEDDDEDDFDDDSDDNDERDDDVNVNLGNEDTDMTNANQVRDTQKTGGPTQSSSVSSDFTSKLLNLDNPFPADNEIAYLMDTIAQHATTIPKITLSFTTTVPPLPPFFNPLSQQATPTPTPTSPTNLEKDLLEIKQVDQYAQSLSSIHVIVDRYIDTKLGEAINKAIQAHNFDCKEEAQAEKREYIELVDLTVRTIIKEEVNAQLPQILPQAISDVATLVIEKNVIVSLEDVNKSYDKADYKKKLYDALVESYNTDKDLFASYGEVFFIEEGVQMKETKSKTPTVDQNRGTKRRKSSKDVESSKDSRSKEKKSAHAEELSHTVKDSGMQQDQEFVTGDNDEQLVDKEVTKADWFKKPE